MTWTPVAARALRDTVATPLLRPLTDRARDDRYARDPFLHLDDGHVWIEDLETHQPSVFRPYEHEEELIAAWVDLDRLRDSGILYFNNVHEEKSRQMGVTWTVAYVLLWALMYHRVKLLAQNVRYSEVVDDGPTTRSLFGKIMFMARESPWPPGYQPDQLVLTRGNTPEIRNPLTGAVLYAEGETSDPGRGATLDAAFLDECARLSWQGSVQAAITRACPTGRLYNSTPHGTDNLFHWLRTLRPAGYDFLRHHWSRHPVYARGAHIAGDDPDCARCAGVRAGEQWDATDLDRTHRYPGRLTSPWYDRAVVELDDWQVAQELDIDYSASLTARVYPEFSEEIHVRDSIPLHSALPIELSFDYGIDTTAIGIWQDAPRELRLIGEVETHDATPEDAAAELLAKLRELGVPEHELLPRMTSTWLSVGDPAGEGRDYTSGESPVVQWRRQGFEIISRTRSVEETIFAMKRLLIGRPKPVRISREGAPLFVAHIQANRWPTDRQGNRKANARAPFNDRHNHALRAAAYLVAFKFPPPDALAEDEPGPATAFVHGLYTRVDEAASATVRTGDPDIRTGMRF